MRQLLFIVAAIIVIIGVVAFVYFAFLSPDSPTLTTGDPFANTGAGDATGGGVSTGATGPVEVTGAGKQLGPSLVRITDIPVAEGMLALYVSPPAATTTTSTTTALANANADTEVRYLDRASGNIYAYLVHARKLTRLSNRTLPGIQRASWLPDGSLAFVQYLSEGANDVDHTETFALTADGQGGRVLEQDLDQVLVGDAANVLTLSSDGSGATGVIAKSNGIGARTAFTSTLSDIAAAFSGKGIVIYTRPSATRAGYGFSVDGATATRLLGPLPGLSLLPSPDGKSILYSYTEGSAIRLAVYDTATRVSTGMPLATLAEKCAWAPSGTVFYCGVPKSLSGTLPDDWYQGAVGFSDRIWELDLSTRLARLLVDPSAVGAGDVDATALALDPKSDALVFTDRRTHALYALDI